MKHHFYLASSTPCNDALHPWTLEEILKEMLSDEDQLKESNETFQTLAAAQRGEAVDPLARFLSDPQQVWAWMQSSDKTERLAAMMNRTSIWAIHVWLCTSIGEPLTLLSSIVLFSRWSEPGSHFS